MKYIVPEVGEIEINTIVFDLNGTLQINGVIPNEVKDKLSKLKEMGMHLVFFSGDARGNANDIAKDLGLEFRRCINSEEKEREFLTFDIDKTAAIGNARIDIGKFKHAKLSIATLQAEGIHTGILEYVDIIVPSIVNALDFFLDTKTFKATMRK